MNALAQVCSGELMWEHTVRGFLQTALSGSDCCNIASYMVFGIIFCAYSGSGKGRVKILLWHFIFRDKPQHRENIEWNCGWAKREDENWRCTYVKIWERLVSLEHYRDAVIADLEPETHLSPSDPNHWTAKGTSPNNCPESFAPTICWEQTLGI